MLGVCATRSSGELALLLMESQGCLRADARPVLWQNTRGENSFTFICHCQIYTSFFLLHHFCREVLCHSRERLFSWQRG